MQVVWFCFFQAEDGIRVAQESHGLGDVYKRQPEGRAHHEHASDDRGCPDAAERGTQRDPCSVSYTPLTLPTTYSVYIPVVDVSLKKKINKQHNALMPVSSAFST